MLFFLKNKYIIWLKEVLSCYYQDGFPSGRYDRRVILPIPGFRAVQDIEKWLRWLAGRFVPVRWRFECKDFCEAHTRGHSGLSLRPNNILHIETVKCNQQARSLHGKRQRDRRSSRGWLADGRNVHEKISRGNASDSWRLYSPDSCNNCTPQVSFRLQETREALVRNESPESLKRLRSSFKTCIRKWALETLYELGMSAVEDKAKKQVWSTRSMTPSNSSTSWAKSEVERFATNSSICMGHRWINLLIGSVQTDRF